MTNLLYEIKNTTPVTKLFSCNVLANRTIALVWLPHLQFVKYWGSNRLNNRLNNIIIKSMGVINFPE